MTTEKCYWEHFEHEADIGIRGVGPTLQQAFEQSALALTAVICDLRDISATSTIKIQCESPHIEILFVDWLNHLVYEMATRKMLFCRFQIELLDNSLIATISGEPVDVQKHQPAVEIKGATYTELNVVKRKDGLWVAQCVVDV